MNQLQSKENHPVLALTMGDPNGIGAEVMLKALDQLSPIRNWTVSYTHLTLPTR